MSFFDLGNSNMGGALGNAPTGLFSGLDPSASSGASYGGTALGGGISGQAAGAMPISGGQSSAGMNPMLMSMLMSQLASSSKSPQMQGSQVPMLAYADPTGVLMPASNGQALGQALLQRGG